MDRRQQRRWVFTGINMLLVFAAVFLINKLVPNTTPKEVSYSEFLNELRADHLSEVQITERELIGILKADPTHAKSRPELTITANRLPGVDEAALLKELEAHPVKFAGHIESKPWIWNLLGWLFPFLFIVFVYTIGMKRLTQGRGAMTFGKNQAKIYDQSSQTKVTFEDVAGVDEAKVELEEIVDFVRQPGFSPGSPTESVGPPAS